MKQEKVPASRGEIYGAAVALILAITGGAFTVNGSVAQTRAIAIENDTDIGRLFEARTNDKIELTDRVDRSIDNLENRLMRGQDNIMERLEDLQDLHIENPHGYCTSE